MIETEDLQQADLSIDFDESTLSLVLNLNIKGLIRHDQTVQYPLQKHTTLTNITFTKLKPLGNDLSWLSYRKNQIQINAEKINSIVKSAKFVPRRKVHKCTKP